MFQAVGYCGALLQMTPYLDIFQTWLNPCQCKNVMLPSAFSLKIWKHVTALSFTYLIVFQVILCLKLLQVVYKH